MADDIATKKSPQLPPAAVGGVGAAIVAALGWLANELLELERAVERVETTVNARVTKVDEDIADIRSDVRDMRDRQLVIEQVLTRTEVRKQGPQ